MSICLTTKISRADETSLSYERDIRPIFRAHCFDCHGATDIVEGNLDLRLVHLMEKGGDSGPGLVKGNLDEGMILERIRSGEMPPGASKLTPEELQKLEAWVAAGAPTIRPEPETIGPGLPLTPEEREWWSFQPLNKPAIPALKDKKRIRTPIDSFLQAAMPQGLKFSPDADRRQLMLRASFDLTGLPPTPEQMQRFTSAATEKAAERAYEKLINELLESPHYGERWGRHWLDVSGYADSDGRTTADAVRPWAYKYRDYVIQSFNENKPFDRFLHEQLAGDELAGPKQGDYTPEQISLLTATGFLRMGADGTGSGDNSEEARNFVIADTLQIVSTSLLGLTVACAQCHDHRYDPISHTDYFALRAVFEPSLNYKDWRTPQQRNVLLYTQSDFEAAAKIEEEAAAVLAKKAEKLETYLAAALDIELAKYEEPLREALRVAYKTPAGERTEEQKAILSQNPSVNINAGNLYQYNQAHADDLKADDAKAEEIRARKPAEIYLQALTEPAGEIPNTHLFYRGDYRQPKQVVEPAAPMVLTPENELVSFTTPPEKVATSGRRLAFAHWLTSRENPITARVLVNRIWMHHFGRGLVDTPADFGRLGAQPTHPELLDWLAVDFMESGWDLKKLHRKIMLSTAYRQSSRRDPAQVAIDDSNRFYGRQNVIRLDAEVLRDRVLAVTGQLDRTIFGPSIPVREDDDGQVVVDGDLQRRSIYIQQRRSMPISMLQAFDAPVMTVNCEKRPSSTVATQSLMLMNSPFTLSQSVAMVNRIMTDTPPLLTDKVRRELPLILPPPQPTWQYGYGGLDDSGKVQFTPFALYKDGLWRVSDNMPDPTIGWAQLNAFGGHAGDTQLTSPIRRWVAASRGKVSITGKLNHSSPNGDGVHSRVVSSRSGVAGEWIAHNQEVETNVTEIIVEAGDTIDLVTDRRESTDTDSFTWIVSIALQMEDGSTISTNSQEAFGGPDTQSFQIQPDKVARAWELAYCRPPKTDELQLSVKFINEQIREMQLRPRELPAGTSITQQALADLCQVLLTSNEFLYIE
ncbi:PSD1 and planctomycete cytochrome C domain-containing protein [Planctomicrobium sp. SH668]|uniref:PSD1 and planctomycete cytochrome C domain-containing protein n=1 Tax=Planctomicrobium sp. SH668 TaxID=3448126 RepID=UPI003F5B6B0D